MKKMNNKLLIIVLSCFLIFISITVIFFNGKTYTAKFDNIAINNIDELNIEIENDIVECTKKIIDNDVLELTFKSKAQGKTFVDITDSSGEYNKMFSLYVHKFGIITYDEYFGNCNGSQIIPISIVIILSCILYFLIKSFRNNIKRNMYQYKNVTYLGLIIFLSFAVINQLFTIIDYHGLIYTIERLISLFNAFSIIVLPIAFILSILVTISNLKLVKKEGFNLRNLLGLILGIFICFMTILPDFLYKLSYSSTFINIHNEQALDLYIYNFIETVIYLIVAYLECILFSTIILSIKAAKYIPSFNKDYILILGCMIKKDGTLTPLLKSRVDRAIEFRNMQMEKTGKNLKFVPSGGKGSDEIISEAEAMKKYLVQNGINEKDILIEDKSKNTYENIKFSNEIISKKSKKLNIAFSTTNYHVFRAGAIAYNQGINIEGIGAKTKSYFWINAFVREFIATLYSEKKTHIKIIIIILLLSILMITLTYLANVI